MNANDLLPKQYISSKDVFDAKGKPTTRTATIAGVSQESVGQGEEKEVKPVLSFVGTDRKLTLNKTNIGALIEFFGTETEDWRGQKVALVGDYTQYQGNTVKALRIRPDNGTGTPLAETFDPETVPF